MGSKCPAKGSRGSALCHCICSRDVDLREMGRRPFGPRVVCCAWKGEAQQVLGSITVYSNKVFCCCSYLSLLQDQEGQLQPSPAAWAGKPGHPQH